MTNVLNILEGDLGLEMDTSRRYTHFECPNCGHYRTKFGISAVNGGYKCLHCGIKGSFYSLLVDIFGWERYAAKLVAGMAAPSELDEVDDEPEVVITMPLRWEDTIFSLPKLYYMKGRGFSRDELCELMKIYSMGHSRLPHWEDCVIFERRDENDNHLGFIGKDIATNRTRNQRGVRLDTMWGAEAIGKSGQVLFATEAIFDALRVQMANIPYSSVVAFCGTGGEKQVEHLATLGSRYTHVVLLMDNDDAGWEAAAKWKKRIPNATHLPLPEGVKDPAEMETEHCRSFLLEQV